MIKEKIKSVLLSSPLFHLSLSSKELFHSNFLGWLGKWHPDFFLAVFWEMGCVLNCPADGFILKREYENFDLCVLAPDGRIVFILENKVKKKPAPDRAIERIRRKGYPGYCVRNIGLLEVKMKFKEDFVLLIQLQGDKYCHCIEWITDRQIANVYEAWEWTCALKDPVPVFLQTDELPAVFPSFCQDESVSVCKRKDARNRNFNKYGNNFLYQYQKIKDEATVSEVLRAIKEEVDALIQKQS